jgi:hypothetical protein
VPPEPEDPGVDEGDQDSSELPPEADPVPDVPDD